MAEKEQIQSLSAPLKFLHDSQQIETDALTDLVNLYCQKDAELAPERAALKIREKELDDVEKQIQESLDAQHKPEEDGVFKTNDWMLQFAPKGKATEVLDKKAILAIVGEDLFMDIITVGITELKKYLTPMQLAAVTKEIHKNKRKLKYAPVSKS